MEKIMSYNEHLLQSFEQGVATLTLNRLKQHNAFDRDLIVALQNALDAIAHNPQVRVVKITANGRFFCAGGDLSWFKNATQFTDAENEADAKILARLLHTLNELPQPTLAVVQGSAFGGGLGLIACCDIAIAVDTATFSLSEVKLGLVPATIAPFIIRAIGMRQLRRYALTAELISATEAHRLGLLHSITEENLLHNMADDIVNKLLQNAPTAIACTKQLLRDLCPTQPEELEKTAALLAKIRVSPEAQEGLKAFFEKRDPAWSR